MIDHGKLYILSYLQSIISTLLLILESLIYARAELDTSFDRRRNSVQVHIPEEGGSSDIPGHISSLNKLNP